MYATEDQIERAIIVNFSFFCIHIRSVLRAVYAVCAPATVIYLLRLIDCKRLSVIITITPREHLQKIHSRNRMM